MRAVAVVVALAGCGRLSFDPLADSQDSNTIPSDGLWVTSLGGADTETWISDIVEEPNGDLWIVGTTQPWGIAYTDGFVFELDATTGTIQRGGVRSFGPGENLIHGAVLDPRGSLFVVGAAHTGATSSFQPASGSIDLDTSGWVSAGWQTDQLETPGEQDVYYDVVIGSDGGALMVGSSHFGAGGCASCEQMDALAVKLDPDGAIVNNGARVSGSSVGDELARGAVALTDGSFVVFGGGLGKYDYSGGAETDVDSPPSYVFRTTTTAAPMWIRQLDYPSARGAGVFAGVYVPALDQIALAGTASFGAVGLLVHMRPDGAVVGAQNVVLDGSGDVTITSVALAPDGGLYLAGLQTADDFMTRSSFYARLAPDHTTVVWAARVDAGYSPRPSLLHATSSGDLIVTAAGTGAPNSDAAIARITANGQLPACWTAARPATVTLEPVTGTATTPVVGSGFTTANFVLLAERAETPAPAGAISSCP